MAAYDATLFTTLSLTFSTPFSAALELKQTVAVVVNNNTIRTTCFPIFTYILNKKQKSDKGWCNDLRKGENESIMDENCDDVAVEAVMDGRETLVCHVARYWSLYFWLYYPPATFFSLTRIWNLRGDILADILK